MSDRKLLFDWVRFRLGRGLTQQEVGEFDALLDAYDAAGRIGERKIGPEGSRSVSE
jgi:hypothetical protein